MSRRDSILDWKTVLDDAEWDREESLAQLISPADLPAGAAPRRRHLRGPIVAGLVLLCGALLASYLWYEAQTGVAAIETEIQRTVAAEDWSHRTGNLDAASSLIDDEASADWKKTQVRRKDAVVSQARTDLDAPRADVGEIYLRSGLAMVQVTSFDELGRAYRETRFYRKSPDGWLRTAPAPEFWGRTHVLETEYFFIRYHDADADAVHEAASHLDETVRTLRYDLALPDAVEKLTIDVAAATPVGPRFPHVEDGYLSVPSPLTVRAPVRFTDSDSLVQTATYPLVTWLWREAHLSAVAEQGLVVSLGSSPYWSYVRRGVQVWQAGAGSDVADQWNEDIATWMYQELPRMRTEWSATPAGTSGSPCDEWLDWRQMQSATLQLDTWCRGPDWFRSIQHMPTAPDRLELLGNHEDWESGPTLTFHTGWMRTVAAASMIDYLVHAHGREKLPQFVDALRTHGSWQALIPEVLGISAEEFEMGWRDYLAEQYGYGEL